MDKKVALNVLGVSAASESDSATLILAESDGNRRLAINIGIPEAQSIAVFLEGIKTPRPLIHDLFYDFSKSFDVVVSEVVIYDLQNNIFCAKIVCSLNGKCVELDARTSDAVAIALRFKCAISIYESLLQSSCSPLDIQKSIVPLEDYSTEELNMLMDKAVKIEDYELASRIRDIINGRS